ncbi:chemotaxis protein CheA [Halorubrum miltondacostae]|uniref:Chemotaxis protein CheA n=1 Tax=Halorubrum miltondacostae TaxID=3076378 RepID=A0ABD5M767_9EURY
MQVRFVADEELVNNFDATIDSSRSEALRNCMEASVAHGKLITEVDVSDPETSGESGVTNHDLLVAIQNAGTQSHNHGGSASTSDEYQEYSVTDERVTDEMAVILDDYESDADVLPDAVTPDDRDDVLSRDILKLWSDYQNPDRNFVPSLNPDHVHEDHRPQGMSHAVALTLGVLRYNDKSTVTASQMVDVVADDLGWTKNYMESNGFVSEIEEAAIENPLNDSKYITDGHTLDDVLISVAAKADSALDTIETSSSITSIESAKSTLIDHALTLDDHNAMHRMADGEFEKVTNGLGTHLPPLVRNRKQEVSQSTVESARLRVDDMRRMFSEFDDVDGLSEIREVMNRISDAADDVRGDLDENTLDDTDVSTILSEIDSVVSEAGVAAGEAAADELQVMVSDVGDADDVEGIEESLTRVVDDGEDAKTMVDSYVDDMADVDVSEVMAGIDTAVSDAAVTAGEAVTAEIQELNTGFDAEMTVAENEELLERIEGLAETARHLVEENTTYDTDVSEVMAGIDEAVAGAEERHSEALEVAVEREAAAAMEEDEMWARRAMRVLEVAEMDDSPIWRDGVEAFLEDMVAYFEAMPDAVTDETGDETALPVDEFQSRMWDLPEKSTVDRAIQKAKYSMSVVEIVERLDLDEIEDRDEAYDAVSEMSLDVVPDRYQKGDSLNKAALEQSIKQYSMCSAGTLDRICLHGGVDEDSESFREEVACAVYEYESAVNGGSDKWVMIEETKQTPSWTPGVLRVDMREYTEFDGTLDQRLWPDSTDWESRLPDDSESVPAE